MSLPCVSVRRDETVFRCCKLNRGSFVHTVEKAVCIVLIVVHFFCSFPVPLLKRRILKKSLKFLRNSFADTPHLRRYVFLCKNKKDRPFLRKTELRSVFLRLPNLFYCRSKKGRNYPFKDNSDPVTQTNAVT